MKLYLQLQGQFGFMPSSMEGCSQERDSLHNVIFVSESSLCFYISFTIMGLFSSQENSVSMMSKHLHD